MKLRTAALTTFSTIILIPSIASAGGHTVEKFMEADVDKNELVSKNEFKEKYEAKFTKMDANNDGDVSADEYEAYIAAKYQQSIKDKFMNMDTDGDGMISLEEMSKHKKSSKHKH